MRVEILDKLHCYCQNRSQHFLDRLLNNIILKICTSVYNTNLKAVSKKDLLRKLRIFTCITTMSKSLTVSTLPVNTGLYYSGIH